MTHDPGDPPVSDPDADRAPAADVSAGETPRADEPSDETTATGADRPEAATYDDGRREVAASGRDRSDATASNVGWSEAATYDGGRSEVAASDGGLPEAAASDVGRPEVATSDVGRSEVTSESSRADAATSGVGRSEVAASDVGRSEVADPYETTRLPVTPPAEPRSADPAPPPAADPSAAPPHRQGGTRIGSALFFDDRLGDSYPHLAEEPSGRTLVDDAPTESMAVVDAGGRHRAEPGGDTDPDAGTEWRPPRQSSRLTTVLVIALLVAIGFLAGVFVGRAAAPAPTGGEQPRPAATSPARPGALR